MRQWHWHTTGLIDRLDQLFMKNGLLYTGLAFLIVTILLAPQGKAAICGRAVLAITADFNSTAPHDPCVLAQILTQIATTSSLINVSTAVVPTAETLPHLLPLTGLAFFLLVRRRTRVIIPPTPPPRR
jgi:hypothetical protein